MLDGIREVESDLGAAVQAGIARERVRCADGRIAEVAEFTVDHMKRHGIRPVIFWGRGRRVPTETPEEREARMRRPVR